MDNSFKQTTTTNKKSLEEEMKEDKELYSYFLHRNQHLCEVNFKYLTDHPEIKKLLSDFLSNCLLHKPHDIFKYTKEYFSIMCLKPKLSKTLIIIGPSGVGKGTLIKKLCNEFKDNINLFVSHTSRKIREGEEDGKSYHFVSEDKFLNMIKDNEFIEYNFYNNNYYGTSKRELDKVNDNSKICLLEIDIKGAKKVYSQGIPAYYIGILPPNNSVLRERLNSRNTESLEQINNRLKIAYNEVKELKTVSILNNRIINDDLDIAYEKLKNVFLSYYPDIDSVKNNNIKSDNVLNNKVS